MILPLSIDDEDRRDRAVAALRGLTELVTGLEPLHQIDPRNFGQLLAIITDIVDEAMPTPSRPRNDND